MSCTLIICMYMYVMQRERCPRMRFSALFMASSCCYVQVHCVFNYVTFIFFISQHQLHHARRPEGMLQHLCLQNVCKCVYACGI
jgi:hypothetical protein